MNGNQRIVVGVTGRGENTDALLFAAREAQLRGCGITLAHAAPPDLPPPPPSMLMTDVPWHEVAEAVAEEVRAELESLTELAEPPEVVVRQGHPGHVLSELSQDAALVVLQHRDLSRLHRFVTGSTVAATAARSTCPVVSVPHGAPDSPRGLVTVGVHEDGGPATVVEAAIAEAALHGCSVRVLHAWRVTAAYDVLLPEDAVWSHQTGMAIGAAIGSVAAAHPDVTVEPDVEHSYPADALVEASQVSDLLVIGRHGHHRTSPPRLGSLARLVVRESACPVMVVPLG